jgi:hypothetical protein
MNALLSKTLEPMPCVNLGPDFILVFVFWIIVATYSQTMGSLDVK